MEKTKGKILLLSLLLVLLVAAILWLFQTKYYFTAFVFLGLGATVLYEINATVSRILQTTAQTLSAVANEDYALKLSNQHLPTQVYQPLQEILHLQKKQNEDNSSIKIIYENIIESIDTGILILKEKEDKQIQIFYSNEAFSNLLGLPRFTHWHLLNPHLKAFDSYLSPEDWKDMKDLVTLSTNGNEQTISLRTFLTKVYHRRYLILNIDTIQNIVDKKEKEAWYNLMKVMSHEILNTITPISSLSDNLEFLIAERANELGDDFDDIQKSVHTIKQRTQHLSDFVNTYRALTELPSPKKERVKIEALINNSLETLSPLIKEYDITIAQQIADDTSYFFIDTKQIEQVLINLITNAIYAVKEMNNPSITIKTYTINNRDCIEVIDNGYGIDISIRKDIFVPFFTTRENGSGIGLSLSKNIIQAHDGFINFSTKEGKTSFVIQLPKI